MAVRNAKEVGSSWPERQGQAVSESFAVTFDEKGRHWLEEHPDGGALVIAYEDTRC